MADWRDDLIYYAAAPIRLFGRSRIFRYALGAVLLLALTFSATLWALDRFFPADTTPPALAHLKPPPPLPPTAQSSYVIAPVAVALTAIHRSLDAAAPHELAGKSDNPVSGLLSKADIGITVTRGGLDISGKPNELSVVTPINGTLRVTGQIANKAGELTGSIAGLLNSDIGKSVGNLTGKVLDERADFRGQVTIHAKPAILANWRLDPNLSAQLALANTEATLAGIKINMATEVRPFVDRAVSEQVGALQNRLREDPFIERAARAQWAKLCRSVALGGGNTGLPRLWLEMKPSRAAAAQPQIDGRNVVLAIGVQADTRVTAEETKPSCPFPAKLELVPPMQNGKVSVGLPIDVPFTALDKLLEAQLKGHRYPEDASAPAEIEVRGVKVAAAGDRLLITLDVKATENKSWFGFGARATLHIWGKPTLDAQNQILRLTDVALAVESEAALFNAAARAALPYLQQALADKAVVDLKPLAADARQKIAVLLADFQQNADGTRVDATINDLKLTGIAFDAHTLRVTAEADGAVNVAVTQLPKI
jgi:hypothetical protein